MSVPPGDRNESTMEFIDTADKIESRAMQVCRKWPKSYMFIITKRTVKLASKIYEKAQAANAIIPRSEDERTQRVIQLQKALGANYAFARKMERAYSMFPICGEKAKATERELEEGSTKLLHEFMDLCAIEEEALKGNIHYTRNMDIGGKKKSKLQEPKE